MPTGYVHCHGGLGRDQHLPHLDGREVFEGRTVARVKLRQKLYSLLGQRWVLGHGCGQRRVRQRGLAIKGNV
jgi:hypothetical protein